MESEVKKVLDELRTIKIDIEFIKEHMVDVDTILTPEEEKRLNLSIDEFKRGRTISLKNFRRV